MPELPEVETVIRTLEKSLKGETLHSLNLFVPALCETDPQMFSQLIGMQFTTFARRGKYLIFGFSNNQYLVVHLRMEGKFHLYTKGNAPHKTKHTHMILETEAYTVHYLDVRKFSRMAVVTDLDAYFKTKNLGFEPFDTSVTGSTLRKSYARRARAIKTVLLDQSIITGIGNIYADEILFAAGIHPYTPAQKLTLHQCNNLVTQTQHVLNQAIAAGGTTIRSYTSSLDVSGRFQIDLNAYGRKGKPCNVCGSIMLGAKLDGRSCVWCPKCQKGKV